MLVLRAIMKQMWPNLRNMLLMNYQSVSRDHRKLFANKSQSLMSISKKHISQKYIKS